MKFVDEVKMDIRAGDGGNGCVAFRREKFVPRGGPSGGNGGRGGDIVLRANRQVTTLLEHRYAPRLRGGNGRHGMGSDKDGKAGEPKEIIVPVGTVATDADTGEQLVDLDEDGATFVVAHGGKGGLGNLAFKKAWNRAPRQAKPGRPGQERTLRLELKLLADVGVLGMPNVGKSTLVSALSAAKPKIADYPFTTLTPSLGVVRAGGDGSFVIADIPGLVPGAAAGAGLGIRFLRHVERTRALVHLVCVRPGEESDPIADLDAIDAELALHDEGLASRPQVLALNKADLAETREAFPELEERLAGRGVTLHLVSAATGEGLDELMWKMWELVKPRDEESELE